MEMLKGIWPIIWPENSEILTGIHKGVDIGVISIRESISSDNSKSAPVNLEVVRDYLAMEVALGRKARPFSQLPFDIFVGLPVDIIIKRNSSCN